MKAVEKHSPARRSVQPESGASAAVVMIPVAGTASLNIPQKNAANRVSLARMVLRATAVNANRKEAHAAQTPTADPMSAARVVSASRVPPMAATSSHVAVTTNARRRFAAMKIPTHARMILLNASAPVTHSAAQLFQHGAARKRICLRTDQYGITLWRSW